MRMHRRFSLLSAPLLAALLLIPGLAGRAFAQQIDIPRIEQMPALPQPYEMRDWAQATAGYDSLVFDWDATGQYLPLIWLNPNPVNYPEHDSFGLNTVVGSPYEYHGEAINVLPAVISATLVGIDKSNQDGYNYPLMCEEFFNNRPEENIYLNGFVAQSGDDWWYVTMPNVFFYQLNDLYPHTGHFDEQFVTVADQFRTCVDTLGGATTPWTLPALNNRGFAFSTMTPYNEGVREPEVAGAIGWLEYMAYHETGNEDYRVAAEQAMEFLDARTSNPSYELQLSYGTYIAARMNAELGTNYDTEQLVNWCFDVGPLRSWGSMLGTWGGYDVDGLIGEVSGNDYAFLMNGLEQFGALVPMTRYDDRFARAIGKWAVNLANASRLYFPNYLDGDHQDSEWWSAEYDPNGYIGHEAMREEYNGYSPFATGDASSGGWGATNLMLYSTSHVGLLGGIIDTTDVEGILILDLLKTDWYHDDAYPSYLVYNPYDIMETVDLPVGDTPVDVYDAVTNTMLASSVTGACSLQIPEDSAVMPVLLPAGGIMTYEGDRMLVNGVVADYRSGQPAANHAPRVKALAGLPSPALINEPVTLYCTAEDIDGDAMSYTWAADAGTFDGDGATVTWNAPGTAGDVVVSVEVSDGNGGATTAELTVHVVDNRPPVISSLAADPGAVDTGGSTALTCTASDPDGDDLTYTWSAPSGSFSGDGASVTWNAPSTLGDVEITCTVSDPDGAEDSATVRVTVGTKVGDYPLNGNGMDESGFGNDGTLFGCTPAVDRGGNGDFCLAFNGSSDHVRVPASPSLNFTHAATVSLWFRMSAALDREEFIISHGSWQNRWKVSIIPEGKVRWTIKTGTGVTDLDSDTQPVVGHWYHLAATYDGSQMQVYIDGELETSRSWSGEILTSDIDLTIGQMLPGDSGYNFQGLIDDVKLYNRALSADEIAALANQVGVEEPSGGILPERYALQPAWPNPFNASTRLSFDLPQGGRVALQVFNVNGRLVADLADGRFDAGRHTLAWNANGLGSGVYFVRMQADGFRGVRKVVLMK